MGVVGGGQVNYCEICSSTWKNIIKSTVVLKLRFNSTIFVSGLWALMID